MVKNENVVKYVNGVKLSEAPCVLIESVDIEFKLNEFEIEFKMVFLCVFTIKAKTCVLHHFKQLNEMLHVSGTVGFLLLLLFMYQCVCK